MQVSDKSFENDHSKPQGDPAIQEQIMKAKPNYDDEELELLQAWEAGWCAQAGQRYV